MKIESFDVEKLTKVDDQIWRAYLELDEQGKQTVSKLVFAYACGLFKANKTAQGNLFRRRCVVKPIIFFARSTDNTPLTKL